ncbi:AI-2E family transporter [Aerococcaceae bacterium NML191292]|nr:AI-2E family transporter [Aerococcaceae bacterium NML210727]MCW6655255.1 AI-2E family transporter [Aerococcaceae bacterium NML201296]MCW6659597.1 AI-2E family transporter [Aerococcaceae bacterium NML191292]MCW6664033.1 AI-2E family transporter [Aerococcaceae bacterium NML190073]MCW6667462.1 AI-2E family transporter [Aerococcaceae bacterium NML190938]MCW6674407.1 AI-2E family transporter [Aerococcaceae bacterium NML171108]MCW6677394.1 AI-2E family transporter [Aerococcaceae bacterium NML180
MQKQPATKSNHELADKKQSWFWRYFLNNQVVTTLLIVLLLLLILWVFTRISHLFSPIGQFLDIVAFPLITAGILFYLFSPIVDRLVKKGMNRHMAIILIFIGIVLLIVWGVSTLYPILQRQTTAFITNLPSYFNAINEMVVDLPYWDNKESVFANLQPIIEGLDLKSLPDRLNSILSSTFGGLGSVVGTITQVVTGLLTAPVVLYYLLLEGHHLGDKLLYYVPTRYRQIVRRMMYQGNYQVSQYIRGQIIVAICVAILFTIGYSIIGLDYGVTLGVVSGFLNIIPFLGSFIAVIPALIIALITSPSMVVKVVIVMMIEQTIEGRFISPQVLGNNMKIHPVTILLVLLAAGKLFGIAGVILGVPGYAIIKVIVSEVYELFREKSGWYEEEEAPKLLVREPKN